MKQTEVKRDFKVLAEKISPENVLMMSELLAIKETKTLTCFMGSFRVLPDYREGAVREISYSKKVYQPRKGKTGTAIYSGRRYGERRLYPGGCGDSIAESYRKHEPCSGLQDVGNELSRHSKDDVESNRHGL